MQIKYPRVPTSVWLVLCATVVAGWAAVRWSRETEAETGCANNLRMIALALQQYASAYDDTFPRGTIPSNSLPPERRLSWLVTLSHFLDQWAWMFDESRSWDDDVNRVTRGHGVGEPVEVVGQVWLLTCPMADKPEAKPMPGLTSYVGVTGLGRNSAWLPAGDPRVGVFGYDRQTRIAGIKDGLATTTAVVETSERGPWTAGGTSTLRGLDPERKPYLGRGRQFGGNHRGGAMVLFADGSVRMIRESIDSNVFEALSTIARGEELPAGWGG
ncbi:MAG: DUF1559 domain-containing protein [Isosphaeraceae bacterium]